MNFKFKKTWRGMVLFVEDRRPIGASYTGPESWQKFWRKATEVEAEKFNREIIEQSVYKKIVDELKEVHPEIMI